MTDTKQAKQRLVDAIVALMGEGMSAEDVVDALVSAISRQQATAQGISDRRRREELLLFQSDAITVLRDALRRLGIARRSARSIAG